MEARPLSEAWKEQVLTPVSGKELICTPHREAPDLASCVIDANVSVDRSHCSLSTDRCLRPGITVPGRLEGGGMEGMCEWASWAP